MDHAMHPILKKMVVQKKIMASMEGWGLKGGQAKGGGGGKKDKNAPPKKKKLTHGRAP